MNPLMILGSTTTYGAGLAWSAPGYLTVMLLLGAAASFWSAASLLKQAPARR